MSKGKGSKFGPKYATSVEVGMASPLAFKKGVAGA